MSCSRQPGLRRATSAKIRHAINAMRRTLRALSCYIRDTWSHALGVHDALFCKRPVTLRRKGRFATGRILARAPGQKRDAVGRLDPRNVGTDCRGASRPTSTRNRFRTFFTRSIDNSLVPLKHRVHGTGIYYLLVFELPRHTQKLLNASIRGTRLFGESRLNDLASLN